MTGIRHRDATPADAATLADLFRRCFVETFGHLYREEDLEAFLAPLGEEGWRAELSDSGLKIKLVEAGGEAVAFAKLGPVSLPVEPEGRGMELRQLYVLKPWQGRGISHDLMKWLLAEAQTAGADELFLSVWSQNARAQRFYARYGFEYVGPYAFMVGSQADEDEIMRLKLPRAR
jgi:ribosomal protein S18 acetylase RimI-like enzyme